MTAPRYAELQVTSQFSFLRGASSAEELFAQAALHGIEALGIVDRNSLAGIVGHGKAVVANGKLLVQGTITPSTDAARQVVDLAKGGFRFQASVGVAPLEYERVRAGELVEVNGRAVKAPASGFTLVRAGVLREVSIVAIGADGNAQVISAAPTKTN